MDLLYRRYASPMELMKIYIKQGRFGEFVYNIIEKENQRKQEEAEKENEQKMWLMYVHSGSGKSFNEWKAQVLTNTSSAKKSGGKDENMTEAEMEGIINSLFPTI